MLSKTEITAPIDGVVTRLDVEQGEMVVMGVQNQPGTILMTVSDLSAVNAEVKVAEADVMRLSNGFPATVTLEALPLQNFTGQVVAIGASELPQVGAQAAAREFRVKVRLEGAGSDARLRYLAHAAHRTREIARMALSPSPKRAMLSRWRSSSP